MRLGRSLYPFLQAELFLPWDEDGFAERIDRTIEVFVREGLLEQVNEDEGGILARNAGQTDEVFRLRAIGHSLQQAFERYYIAISVLVKNGAGTLSSGELESLCQLAAQRLSLLYAPAAPEFFDKTLFRGFIQKLRELKLVWPDANGKLAFDERLNAWAKDARIILGRELRHTIEKVSPEAAVKPAASGRRHERLRTHMRRRHCCRRRMAPCNRIWSRIRPPRDGWVLRCIGPRVRPCDQRPASAAP